MAERVRRGRHLVRLVEPAADGLTWWCEVPGVPGESVVDATAVPPGAAADSCWIAEVAHYDDGTAVVLRVTAPFDPDDHDDHERSDAEVRDTRTFRRDARATRGARPRHLGRLDRGTVVLAHITFTGTPGRDDAHRWGKDRPCAVIADHGDELELQPLFSGPRRDRLPVRDWRAAGLDGETSIDPATRFVTPDAVDRVIGRLSERDHLALNPPRRPS